MLTEHMTSMRVTGVESVERDAAYVYTNYTPLAPLGANHLTITLKIHIQRTIGSTGSISVLHIVNELF